MSATRKQQFSIFLVICLAQLTQALGVGLLASDGQGRMNHPILFLHGVGNSAQDWQLSWAYDRCVNPKPILLQVSPPSLGGSGSLVPLNESGFVVEHLFFSVEASGTLTCQDGRTFPWTFHYGNLGTKLFKHDANGPTGYILPVARISGENLVFDGGSVDVPAKNVVEDVGQEWASKTDLRSADWPGKPANLVPAGPDHLIQTYDKGSTPAFLAARYGLTTDFSATNPTAGINHNGLYFFSAMQIKGCSPTTRSVRLSGAQSYWEKDDRTCQGGGGAVSCHFYTIKPALFANLTVDVSCPEINLSQTISLPGMLVARYSSPVGESQWNEPATTFSVDPLTWNANFSWVDHGISHSGTTALPVFSAIDAAMGTVTAKSLDGFTLPHWDLGLQGQSGQVYARMKEVLDDYYGVGNWQNNPDAKIDLVAHSQGGLVARELIRGATDPALSNPVNHIGQIVTLGTPHLGSAVVTNGNLVQAGHADAWNPKTVDKYPVLGRAKDELISTDWHLVGSGSLQLNVPYAAQALLFATTGISVDKLPELKLDLYDRGLVNGFRVDGNFAGFNVFSKSFDLGNTTSRLNSIFKATHMAWSEESPFINTLRQAPYPTYPATGKNIPITALYSKSVESMVSEVVAQAPGIVTQDFCLEAIANQQLGYWTRFAIESVAGPLSDICAGGLYGIAQKLGFADELLRLKDQALLFDNEWSQKGDFVVEAKSQRGLDRVNPSKFWLDANWPHDNTVSLGNPQFRTFSFVDSRVAHGTLRLPAYGVYASDGVCMDRPGEWLQYLDIDRYLNYLPGSDLPGSEIDYGGASYCDREQMMTAHQTGTWDGVVASTTAVGNFDLHARLNTQATTVAARALVIGDGAGRVAVRQNASEGTRLQVCQGTRCSMDLALLPAMSEELEVQRQGNTWTVGARVGASWVRQSFQQALASVVAVQKVTATHGQWQLNQDAVVWGDPGTPSDSLKPQLVVEARENALGQSNVSQPWLRVRNSGATTLHGFTLDYWFTADSVLQPKVEAYYLAGGAFRLDTLGGGMYRIHFKYTGDVAPGATFPAGSGIQWGLHYALWEPWTMPSPSSVKTSNWSTPSLVVVRDTLGRRLSGVEPNVSMILRKLSADLVVESQETALNQSNLVKPVIRIHNNGTGPMGTFTAKYFFKPPVGKTLVADPYYLSQTGSSLAVVQEGDGLYSVSVKCPHLAAGQVLEIQFGLHSSDWSVWDKRQDLSGAGVATWTPNGAILVQDPMGILASGQWSSLHFSQLP